MEFKNTRIWKFGKLYRRKKWKSVYPGSVLVHGFIGSEVTLIPDLVFPFSIQYLDTYLNQNKLTLREIYIILTDIVVDHKSLPCFQVFFSFCLSEIVHSRNFTMKRIWRSNFRQYLSNKTIYLVSLVTKSHHCCDIYKIKPTSRWI